MVTGSCLCGGVKYSITGQVGNIVHCHCETCRKAHSAAFSSVAAVADSDFSVQGREHLNSYESSPGKQRFFCSNCGSQIYAKRDGASHVILRLGCLDDDPQAKEQNHIWVSQKACWYSINSQLPEHDEY